MEEIEVDVVDLTDEPLDLKFSEEEIGEFEKNCLYCIGKDEETGFIEIRPMNKENCITLYGAEWVRDFIKHLEEFIEE